MQYGEGDPERAFFGFHNSDQLSNAVTGFAASTAYSGLKWFANGGYQRIKDLYDLRGQIRKEKKMARFKRGRRGYRKRGFKRRRIGRRRGFRRLGRRVRALSKVVRRTGLRSTETKYFTTAQNGTIGRYTDSATPLINITNVIDQGLGPGGRVGGRIFLQKIKIYIQFTASDTASNPEQWVRWIFVRDMKPTDDAASPQLNQIIQQYGLSGPTTQSEGNKNMMIFRYINTRQTGRFQWLWSGMLKVSNNGGSGDKTKMLKKVIRVYKPVNYGSAAIGTTLGTGQIYGFAYSSDFTTTAANMVSYQTVFRVSWTDL